MKTASRAGAFSVVGVLGYAVQTAVLWLLAGRADVPVVPATLVATEAAVLHNFAWHVRWTWADRPAGPKALAARLLKFNLANGGVSLAGGAALMALLVHGAGLHYLPANLVSVLLCSVVNFAASDSWVFREEPRAARRTARRPEGVAGRQARGRRHGPGDGEGLPQTTYRATAT